MLYHFFAGAKSRCATSLHERQPMSNRSTISAEYRAQQQALHQNPDYGVASLGFAPIVKNIMEATQSKSLSDYGAGKCNLRRGLHEAGKTDFDYFPYDPAFPEYGAPKPADLVCCIDVLEHIEQDFLEAVLLDLNEITRSTVFSQSTSSQRSSSSPMAATLI